MLAESEKLLTIQRKNQAEYNARGWTSGDIEDDIFLMSQIVQRKMEETKEAYEPELKEKTVGIPMQAGEVYTISLNNNLMK
jgi:hypothetical protein